MVTNLLVSAIFEWSGQLQAWSTRWLAVDTNGVTNDFRVLLVFSDLQPTATPWLRNLRLHGTNSVVLSDTLNVYGSIERVDAQSLTLTTNGAGLGATSLDGELNWDNPAVLGVSSQFPNLLWVTNYGAIRAWNSGCLWQRSHELWRVFQLRFACGPGYGHLRQYFCERRCYIKQYRRL